MTVEQIKQEWSSNRWKGIIRPYSAEDVTKLTGSINIKYTLAENGAKK